MAQQEEGWPLGLRPLNARVGLERNRDLSGSVSFSTLLTGSPTSSIVSSSDLDTESTGSFFHDKSITLGSLIGVSSILGHSRRSTRGRTAETVREGKNHKHRSWLFSLCSKLGTDAVNASNTPSLGHFLEEERRAATVYRRNQSPDIYGPSDFSTVPSDNSDLHGCLGFGNCNAIKIIDFDFDFVGDNFKNGLGDFKGLVETLMGVWGIVDRLQLES